MGSRMAPPRGGCCGPPGGNQIFGSWSHPAQQYDLRLETQVCPECQQPVEVIEQREPLVWVRCPECVHLWVAEESSATEAS